MRSVSYPGIWPRADLRHQQTRAYGSVGSYWAPEKLQEETNLNQLCFQNFVWTQRFQFCKASAMHVPEGHLHLVNPNIYYFFCSYSVWTKVKKPPNCYLLHYIPFAQDNWMKWLLMKIPANIHKGRNALCTVLLLCPLGLTTDLDQGIASMGINPGSPLEAKGVCLLQLVTTT